MSRPVRTATDRAEVIATRVGCIVCRLEHSVFSAPHLHHLNEGVGYRVWYRTIGLCPFHHTNGGYGNALHAGKLEFERKHGTEEWLLEQTDLILEYLLTEEEYLTVTNASTSQA